MVLEILLQGREGKEKTQYGVDGAAESADDY